MDCEVWTFAMVVIEGASAVSRMLTTKNRRFGCKQKCAVPSKGEKNEQLKAFSYVRFALG